MSANGGDVASWLPWLIGPIDIQSDGTSLEPRGSINFVGAVISDDEETDTISIDVAGAWHGLVDVELVNTAQTLTGKVSNTIELDAGTYRVDGPGDFDTGTQLFMNPGSFGVSASAESTNGGISLGMFNEGSLFASFLMSASSNGISLEVFGSPGSGFAIHPSQIEAHSAAFDFTADTGMRLAVNAGQLELAVASGEELYLNCGLQTTVGAAGGASTLPATPTRYIKIKTSVGNLCIPAYAR